MQEHEKRVVEEKKELDDKRVKLNLFIKTDLFNNLQGMDKELLRKQLNIMDQYSDLLSERIRRFPEDDLGELDSSKACSTEYKGCESCQ